MCVKVWMCLPSGMSLDIDGGDESKNETKQHAGPLVVVMMGDLKNGRTMHSLAKLLARSSMASPSGVPAYLIICQPIIMTSCGASTSILYIMASSRASTSLIDFSPCEYQYFVYYGFLLLAVRVPALLTSRRASTSLSYIMASCRASHSH